MMGPLSDGLPNQTTGFILTYLFQFDLVPFQEFRKFMYVGCLIGMFSEDLQDLSRRKLIVKWKRKFFEVSAIVIIINVVIFLNS